MMKRPSLKSSLQKPAGNSGGPLVLRGALKISMPILLLGAGIGTAHALDHVIEPPPQFLAEAFGANNPTPGALQLNNSIQTQINSILGHDYPQQRVHYWRYNGKTAWLFDDIAKKGYQPVTAGFVVQNGTIDIARVLIYRESHGEEIEQPSFLQQFTGQTAAGNELSKPIDGISGATLSIILMKKLARVAIALDAVVR